MLFLWKCELGKTANMWGSIVFSPGYGLLINSPSELVERQEEQTPALEYGSGWK